MSFCHVKLKSRLVLWLVIALAPMVVGAQVERVANAFQLARFASLPNGEYVYDYRLIGPGRGSREIYSDVFLDISSPKTSVKPSMSGSRGTFLFDALGRNFADAEFGHAPLFIGSPEPWWMSSIWMSGSIAWSATRYAEGANYGVRAGQQLLGFELRSPGIPSLRRYRVVPYRPFGGDEGDGPDGPPPPKTDSSWVIAAGVVLAPGWPDASLTGEFLQMQVSLGCEGYLLTNCGRYLLLTDAVLAAEKSDNDIAWKRALDAIHAFTMTDTKSSATARFAINTAAGALLHHPPSSRKAPATPPRR